ncbi:MAG TPA: GYF domain-containing protein [Hyphomicrobiaceae bacterium]|nr:GYF domain-containing protein [Hyphomicrobiaceae bacterium]
MTGNSTEILWYIARDGQQHGPISETEMRLFVDNGHLRPTDLLWQPGFADWRPATTVFPASAKPAGEPVRHPPEASSETAQPQQKKSSDGEQTKATTQPARRSEEKPAETVAPASPATTNVAMATATPASPAGARPAHTQPAVQASSPSPGSAQKSHGQASARQGPYGGHQSTSGPRARDNSPKQSKAPTQTSAPMASGATATVVPYEPAGAGADSTPAGTGRGRKLALAAALVVMIGGSLAFIVSHKDNIIALVAGANSRDEVPLVKVETPQQTKAHQETAALQSPVQPEPPPAVSEPQSAQPAQSAPASGTPGDQTALLQSTQTPTTTPAIENANTVALDRYYQQSKLWQYMKQTFPDWYSEHINAAAALGNGAVPPRDATKSMVEGLVALRRQHANEALQANTDMLKSIASAFLNNLQSLAEKGPDTCYGFISQGETSPGSVDLFHKPQSTPELEAQALTIFEAITAGRTAPTQHERPKKGDYDVLAAELGKLGWSQADLQLFADPKALSNAPHARVCTMVRDWFKAHIAISDAAVQERLLYETLRPVVAG